MLKTLINRGLLAMENRYAYDVGYLQFLLRTNLLTFLKFALIQGMSAHRGKVPPEAYFAARLRATLWDDCGPCTQLVINMAIESEVAPDILRAIIDGTTEQLPDTARLAVTLTEAVLAHDPAADELRDEVVCRWGNEGLIGLAYCISSARVYPALKYTLGYGQACSRVQVGGDWWMRGCTARTGKSHV